jgi:hypothetical protein
MAGSLQEVMSEMSLDDIQVGPDGRVHIANPDLASRIGALKGTASAVPTNGTCGPNGHHCGRSLQ